MLICKNKNFLPLLIIGLILSIIGLIYGLVAKNWAVLLLMVIFGVFLIGLATFFMIKRHLGIKQLKLKIANKEYIKAKIAEIHKVQVTVAKVLKDTPYEIVVETKVNGTNQILVSDWVDLEFIQAKNIAKGQEIDICFADKNNYYLAL